MADGGPDAAPAPTGPSGAGVARNVVWLLGSELTAKVASIVFVVIVARAIGVEEYGWFTFATAFTPLLLIVGSLGLHQSVVRALVTEGSSVSEVFASGLAIRLLTGVVAVGLSVALAPLFLDDRLAVATVAVVGLALFLDATTSFLSSLFEAHGSVRAWATALVINRVGSTLLALLAYLSGGGLGLVLASYLVGSAAGLGYGLRALHRQFPAVRLRDARRSTATGLLRAGAPLGVAALLNMALLRLDTLMIAAMLGAVQVGLYGVAFRFYESFLFLAYALGEATFARYASKGGVASSARTCEAAMTVATALYTPLLVLSLFAAPWAVDLLFGQRYADGGAAVPWLTAAVLMFGITFQARSLSVGLGARSTVVTVAGVALAVNATLNLVLIPRHGITGAAAATAASAAVETVLTLVALRRQGMRVGVLRAVAPALAVGAVVAGLLLLLDLRGGVAVLVGGAAFLVLLPAVARALPAEQRTWAAAVVRRRG